MDSPPISLFPPGPPTTAALTGIIPSVAGVAPPKLTAARDHPAPSLVPHSELSFLHAAPICPCDRAQSLLSLSHLWADDTVSPFYTDLSDRDATSPFLPFCLPPSQFRTFPFLFPFYHLPRVRYKAEDAPQGTRVESGRPACHLNGVVLLLENAAGLGGPEGLHLPIWGATDRAW